MISQFMRVVEKQDEIIAAQSAIIDELCQLMVEHITVEEFADLEVMRKINRVVAIKKELERINK